MELLQATAQQQAANNSRENISLELRNDDMHFSRDIHFHQILCVWTDSEITRFFVDLLTNLHEKYTNFACFDVIFSDDYCLYCYVKLLSQMTKYVTTTV